MARSFDGSTDYASIADNAAVDLGPLTVCAKIYLETPSNAWHTVFIKGRDGTSIVNYAFSFNPTGGTDLAQLFWADGTFRVYSFPFAANVPVGQWFFLAATLTQNGGDVDGRVLIDMAEVENSSITATLSGGLNNDALILGAWRDVGVTKEPTDCRIANLSGYNQVLTDNQIRGIGDRFTDPANHSAFWPLFGLDSPEPELSGVGIDATLVGTSKANHPPTTLFTPKWAATIPFAEVAAALDPDEIMAAQQWGRPFPTPRRIEVVPY